MKSQEHIIFSHNSNYTVNAFCIGKCSEFRKTILPRHRLTSNPTFRILWGLFLVVNLSKFGVRLSWLMLRHGTTVFETWQKQSYSYNFIFTCLKSGNFLSRRNRRGITLEVTHHFICGAADLIWWLRGHYKELQTCKYFWDCNIPQRKNIKEKKHWLCFLCFYCKICSCFKMWERPW